MEENSGSKWAASFPAVQLHKGNKVKLIAGATTAKDVEATATELLQPVLVSLLLRSIPEMSETLLLGGEGVQGITTTKIITMSYHGLPKI